MIYTFRHHYEGDRKKFSVEPIDREDFDEGAGEPVSDPGRAA